ncbi:E3 ubiquitin-protein ligase UBR3-like [Gigantopelta aegis]|uniref:E3 ubiquitin-protein ligase UBR3-like n=1 Tax=Gigantopelta aegis TaxID=1735272 RepID=UPI001B88AE29|nr:E3 ubiquitin-protein ligase UBR3-like [Gigantopelta aegis]
MASSEMPSGSVALSKRSKRSVATYFKGECGKQCNPQKLHDFLEHILSSARPIDEFETIDWCKWLIAGGSTFDEFSKIVRQYDNAITCGLVWTANFVAYRCRTCGVSPCMSLCSDCFQAGNHEGHDFNMFRSQAGGACDCGDVSVMNPSGFCRRHGPDRQHHMVHPPGDIMANAEAMMPQIFLRLLYHLRDNCKPEMRNSYVVTMMDAEQYMGFIQGLSDMGAAMRNVMASMLTNTGIYKKLTQDRPGDYCKTSQENYTSALQSMPYPDSFEKHQDKPGLQQALCHETFVEELVFWTVKYEFPQKMVTLLLSLLPHDGYKNCFTKAFVQHYSRISIVLVNALDRVTVANRVVHVSVQLFSNEALATKMADEYNLLYTLVLSLTNMIENIRVGSALEETDPMQVNNFHSVADCSHDVMKSHCYWPIISDFINMLSHRKIALRFLKDEELVTRWMDLLAYLQGMNLNQRVLTQHVEFESDTYYAAFSAELEISASPMWSLLSHCSGQENSYHILRMIAAAQIALQDWFTAINCKNNMKPNPYQLTFHLPLHRYLAAFMMTAVKNLDIKLTDILPEDVALKKIMIHVLQIQVSLAQIYAGMWVRNGIQIKGQAMTYVQCHFCYSMADADLYLLQVCGSQLDPDYFVKTILERFHLLNWLSFSSKPSHLSIHLEPSHETAMLEGALALLSTLLGIRTYLGIGDKELVRLEMASLLCMGDRQHSQLQDLMPEKSGVSGHGKEYFESTLKELADYKAPVFEAGGGMQQGTYVPKAFLWDTEYDPIHVSLRAIYKRDQQAALDRYTEHIRQTGKYQKKTSPWPPFKIPGHVNSSYKGLYKILNCRTIQAFLFTILYKAVHKELNLPDSVLYYTIHLLDLSLHFSPSHSTKRVHSQGTVNDGQFHRWFSSSDIKQNARETIHEIVVQNPVSETEEADSCTVNVDMDTSTLEEMFQLAPSTASSHGGPITASHLSGIPSMMSLPGSSGGSPTYALALPTSHPPGSPTQVKPKYESRGVVTEQFHSTPYPVNENLITLLVKLHNKLSGKSNSYACSTCEGGGAKPSEAAVGDGPFYVGRFLDRLCRQSSECAKLVSEIAATRQQKEKDKKQGQTVNQEERRKKAWERQQKLMAEFASKQKAFMEQAMEEEEDASEETTQEKSKSEEKLLDCVICGQSTPSTGDSPVGLVVFLQSSSVLGHRLRSEKPRVLLEDGSQLPKAPCATFYKKHLETLLKNFEEGSCQMSLNIGWEGGVVVQTCGHYLHLTCHGSYLESLKTQNPTENLSVNKGEYWCPLCRQLSNSVIPVVPDENKFTLVKPVSPDPHQMAFDLAELMVKRPITPGSANLTKAMGSVMEDLTNSTHSAYKTYTMSHGSECVLLFVCSVARTNLEVELLQRGGTLDKPPPSIFTKKNCFLPMLHVLSLHSKLLTMRPTPYTDLWAHITGVSLTGDSTSVTKYQKNVPLLLKDVTALLIQFILTLPISMETEHFDFLVQMLYNVVYVQALAVMSCKFTSEEREAWRKKGQKVPFETMDGILSHIITRLSLSRLFDDADKEKGVSAFCQSVWSPQSVEDAIEEFVLPFLRIAALLKHHLFGIEFSPSEGSSEFQYLAVYLGLLSAPTTQRDLNAMICMRWAVPNPIKLTQAWCTDYLNFVSINFVDGKSLLLVKPMWNGPHLIILPDQYYRIFQRFRSQKCEVCNKPPRDPTICLICGDFLCFRDSCCRQNMVYECVQHSVTCGGGTGIFLLINSSVIVVIRGPRATLWGSIYLDEHGEEDRDLKRGKPLFLSKERYELLETQWRSHNFDHVCKKWIWHRDRL